jgi:hypothetical protein
MVQLYYPGSWMFSAVGFLLPLPLLFALGLAHPAVVAVVGAMSRRGRSSARRVAGGFRQLGGGLAGAIANVGQGLPLVGTLPGGG